MAQQFGKNLINRSDPVGEHPVLRGYVSTVRPAPKAFGEPLWVIIPEYSTEAPYKCSWAEIHGKTLPAQGAQVVVVMDNEDVPTAVWWEGAYTP